MNSNAQEIETMKADEKKKTRAKKTLEWSFGGFRLVKDGEHYRIYAGKQLVYATTDAGKLDEMCRMIEKRGK